MRCIINIYWLMHHILRACVYAVEENKIKEYMKNLQIQITQYTYFFPLFCIFRTCVFNFGCVHIRYRYRKIKLKKKLNETKIMKTKFKTQNL